MNPRERIQAVLRHEQPDRVPKMVNFYPCSFLRHPLREAGEVFDTEIRFVSISAPRQQDDFLRHPPRAVGRSLTDSQAVRRHAPSWSV